MTSLINRNQNTTTQIDSINNAISQLQEQLKTLTGEVRVLNQQHKAQENLTKEWKKTCNQVKALFKDACSVYGDPDALDDMIEDLQDSVNDIKANFDDYQNSDRYLNQDTAEIEDLDDEQELQQLEATNNTQTELVLPSADKTVTKSELKSFWKQQELITQNILRTTLSIPDDITRLTDIVHYLYTLNPTWDIIKKWCEVAEEKKNLLLGKLEIDI